jgi:mono/diheme cytochrome c family protein
MDANANAIPVAVLHAMPRLGALLLLACAAALPAQEKRITAPRIWDAEALKDWALPVAGLGVAPTFVDPETYYRRRVDNLATYPVYHPSREPKGYREQLLRRGPRPLIEPERLVTEADWLAAGKLVFEQLDDAATRTDDALVIEHFTNAAAVDKYRDAHHDAVTADGVILDYRWVVDLDGKLKMSTTSCAGCHTRLMEDGTLLAGAPSNFDLGESPASARLLRPLSKLPDMTRGQRLYMEFGVPWRDDDVHDRFRTMTPAQLREFFAQDDGAPPGTTFDRFGGSPFFATRMADLRGIRDRHFLDATATHRHRGPEDIARYAILVEFAEVGDFGPHHMIPARVRALQDFRPPDDAVYALALWLESLDVPPSPHAVDDQVRRGEKVFASEGCKKCHAGPHYTNNELVAAPGFTPAPRDVLPVMDRTVDTDPGLALRTRKGTGYYKVPSLRGLWYRDLLEHDGSIRTLEDWFDERRLRADYRPTGWRGHGVAQRAVPGHEFGLDLEPADKAALIAFLRTL